MHSLWPRGSFAVLVLFIAASAAAQNPTAPARVRPTPQDDFAKNLIAALDFIDYPDLLDQMTRGNTAPWKDFDDNQHRPLLDRWLDAIDTAKIPVEPTDVVKELLELHLVFDGNPQTTFREVPLDFVGGDIGKPDPNNFLVEHFVPMPGCRVAPADQAVLAQMSSAPGFFDQVNARQLANLQTNPFLKLEFHAVSDVARALCRDVFDVGGSPIPRDQFLIRYDYPNAKRWHEFATLLSAPLQQQLAAAEQFRSPQGALCNLLDYNRVVVFNSDPGLNNFNCANTGAGGVSPQFRTLNKLMLQELLAARFGPTDTGPNFFKNYRRLIAVHPFQDFNGRSLRSLYRRHVGRPLFVINFNHDLYEPEASFAQDIQDGAIAYDFIKAGLASEDIRHRNAALTNPRDMPLFFDRPEWWMVLPGSDDLRALSNLFRSDRSLIFDQNGGPGRLQLEGRRWISEGPVRTRIDKKFFDTIVNDFRADLRESKILPQNPVAPLQRTAPPHVPESTVPTRRQM
jgi:hypothetical protein